MKKNVQAYTIRIVDGNGQPARQLQLNCTSLAAKRAAKRMAQEGWLGGTVTVYNDADPCEPIATFRR